MVMPCTDSPYAPYVPPTPPNQLVEIILERFWNYEPATSWTGYIGLDSLTAACIDELKLDSHTASRYLEQLEANGYPIPSASYHTGRRQSWLDYRLSDITASVVAQVRLDHPDTSRKDSERKDAYWAFQDMKPSGYLATVLAGIRSELEAPSNGFIRADPGHDFRTGVVYRTIRQLTPQQRYKLSRAVTSSRLEPPSEPLSLDELVAAVSGLLGQTTPSFDGLPTD